MYRANVEGTRALMTAALDAGVERVVYTSSVATLGLVAGGSADEETPSSLEDMIGPYKRSKFQAEEVVRDLVERRGLPAVIVNPSTPVGPRDRKPTPTGRLILEAARGHMPGYVDTGLNIAHVEDVAVGHLAAAETGRVGERYILGGEDMSLAQILVEVARAAGARAPRMRVPYSVAYPAAIGAELVAPLTGREPFITRDGGRLAGEKMDFSSAQGMRGPGYVPPPARHGIARPGGHAAKLDRDARFRAALPRRPPRFSARRHEIALSRLGRSDGVLPLLGVAGRAPAARPAWREPRGMVRLGCAVLGAASPQPPAGLWRRLPPARSGLSADRRSRSTGDRGRGAGSAGVVPGVASGDRWHARPHRRARRDRARPAGSNRLVRAATRKCRNCRAGGPPAAPAAARRSVGSSGQAANI